MSEGIVIKTAARTVKRQFRNVFKNDVRKYIAEIITNSDDSYNRLVSSGQLSEDEICPIYINFDRKKKIFTIVDNAEGMDLDELQKNFSVYGADTSGKSEGKKVRGLYGQGATDVFINACMENKIAEIDSIKNDKFYTCKFKSNNGESRIHPQQAKKSHSALRDLRQHYSIPKNGTIVRFGLPDNVTIPRNVADEIQNFYMLRFILNNDKRKIVFRTKTASGFDEKILKYEFPEDSENNLLLDEDLSFNYEEQNIKGHLSIYAIADIEAIKHGELKILTYDDAGSVYDNTLFDFQKIPGADTIHGYLELFGTSEIISRKLNQEKPDEILTATRDGFNKFDSFYKSLSEAIDPLLQKVLHEVNSSRTSKDYSLDNHKDWSEAFKAINKYFKQELGEEIGGVDKGTEAPAEGLRFVFPSIKITAGKTYTLKLLINTKLIPIGSKITIHSKSSNIEATPTDFTLSEKDVVKNNLSSKSISIKGLVPSEDDFYVLAESDNITAKLFVKVIDKDIHYPKYGLEFWPNNVTVRNSINAKGHLFFDINKIALGSAVNVSCDNEKVILLTKEIELTKQHLITESVGVADVIFKCDSKEEVANIVATVGNSKSKLLVAFKEYVLPPPSGSSGFLSGVKLTDANWFWQTAYFPKEGTIYINKQNNVNKLLLGEISENKKLSKDQSKYLAELCAFESAKQLVKRKTDKGKIAIDDFEAFMDEVQKEKNKLLDIFVTHIENLL